MVLTDVDTSAETPGFSVPTRDNDAVQDFHSSDPVELRVLATLTSGPLTAAEVASRTGEPELVVQQALEQHLVEQAVTKIALAKAPAYSLTPKGLHAVGVYQGVQGAVDSAGHVDLGAAARMVMEEYDAARDVATEDAVREQAGWQVDDAARDRVTSALEDAYARGALTKEQLDDRTGRALGATTMGDLRAAADGVLEVPPVLPTGVHAVSTELAVDHVEINPALRRITWRHLVYAALYVVIGLFVTMFQPVVGILAVLVGLGLGVWTLRPLLTGR